MIYYIPLEHIEMRYTTHLDHDIRCYLDASGIEYSRIYPDIEKTEIKKGSFLDAAFTTRFKSLQMNEIASLYDNDIICDGDKFFFSDLWFPGIEAIAYMNYFCKKKVMITGLLHAGSFTDTDFVRDMERWAKNFEDIIFDITDKIFVGSNFIKYDVCKKRIVDPRKILVTGFPLDPIAVRDPSIQKEKLVVFNGRNVDEKQPWLFDKLAEIIGSDVKFINTQKQGYTKEEYYRVLNRATVVVSFALQENFGFGILEAVKCGCIPIVPNRLAYVEQFSGSYLYNTFDECVTKVMKALNNQIIHPEIIEDNPMEVWFK